MTKKKKQKDNSKSKGRKFPILRIITCIFIVALLGLLGMYGYVDTIVQKRLDGQVVDMKPGILTDSFRITSKLNLAKEHLLQFLERRNYKPAIGKVQNPGEYILKDEYIEFITRGWVDSNERIREPEHVMYDFETHSVFNITNPGKEFCFLEPEIITYLDGSDVKVQRYKDIKAIPKYLQTAVVAIEDERFFIHPGIDFIGTMRALIKNLRAGRVVEGGSTITQQLAKNLFFTPERTLTRKILEAFAALSLEFRSSKEKILEMYLNEVYLGQEGTNAIHGVAKAATTFFQKPLDLLTLEESALLAGIIKAPSYYSPRKHLKRALQRKETVLSKMLELGLLSKQEFAHASRTPITVHEASLNTQPAPFFIDALKKELAHQVNLDAGISSGMSVHTGIHLDAQICAEQAVRNGLKSLRGHPRRKNPTKELEAALVSIDVATGKIRAWVGGKDYLENQFDRVSQSRRQVGSTIKPFVYLTALDWQLNDYKVATAINIVSDEPLEIELPTNQIWSPENYSKEFQGDVTLRYAFENSLNIPAVYIGQKVGIETVAKTIKKFGVSDNVPAFPALALGALDTSLLNLTSAYGAIANSGMLIPAKLFTNVYQGDKILLKAKHQESQIASEEAVYVLKDLMMGVIQRGTGKVIRRLGYEGAAAGKTGTSNETRDAWFVGFNPSTVTGVWVGHDDNSETGLTGGSAAAPIWGEYMKCISPFYEQTEFVPPPGVVFLNIDFQTRSIATPDCPSELIAKEVFVRGTEPKTFCRGRRARFEEPEPEYSAVDPFKSDEKPEKKRRRGLFDILFN